MPPQLTPDPYRFQQKVFHFAPRYHHYHHWHHESLSLSHFNLPLVNTQSNILFLFQSRFFSRSSPKVFRSSFSLLSRSLHSSLKWGISFHTAFSYRRGNEALCFRILHSLSLSLDTKVSPLLLPLLDEKFDGWGKADFFFVCSPFLLKKKIIFANMCFRRRNFNKREKRIRNILVEERREEEGKVFEYIKSTLFPEEFPLCAY